MPSLFIDGNAYGACFCCDRRLISTVIFDMNLAYFDTNDVVIKPLDFFHSLTLCTRHMTTQLNTTQ